MINVQDVLKLEFAFYDTFTNRLDTSWGSIFCNESQPKYYDANHGHISETCVNPKLVVDEVISYYQSKKIIPRFYLYNLDIQQNIMAELKSRNFNFEELIGPVQLWNHRINETALDDRITIEQVTEVNYREALDIECSIKEFGGREAIEKVYETQFNHPAFTHYLLRYEGQACSTACIFEFGNQARLESVATAEEFRGRGFIGVLIQFIQTEAKNRGIHKLWVTPINETVEQIYQKYNFQTVTKIEMVHAFMSGKSIKEIQS